MGGERYGMEKERNGRGREKREKRGKGNLLQGFTGG